MESEWNPLHARAHFTGRKEIRERHLIYRELAVMGMKQKQDVCRWWMLDKWLWPFLRINLFNLNHFG